MIKGRCLVTGGIIILNTYWLSNLELVQLPRCFNSHNSTRRSHFLAFFQTVEFFHDVTLFTILKFKIRSVERQAGAPTGDQKNQVKMGAAAAQLKAQI